MTVLAVVWTFWMAVGLMIVTCLAFVALGIGYLVKAVSLRYPPGPARQRIDAVLRQRR